MKIKNPLIKAWYLLPTSNLSKTWNFSKPLFGILAVNIRINKHFLYKVHKNCRFAMKLLENWDPDKKGLIVLSLSILDVAIKTCYKIVSSRHICVISFVKLDEIRTPANKRFKKCCGIQLFSSHW